MMEPSHLLPNKEVTSNSDYFHIDNCDNGFGLFTKRNWNNGEYLFNLSGDIVPFSLASNYAIQISETHLKESYPKFNDYIMNHSCDPNCKISFSGQPTVQAIRDISALEELTWDYETTEENMVKFGCDFVCKCKSKKCRGHIKGFTFCGRSPEWTKFNNFL
jgi:SET domain-containing protein